MLLPPGFTQQSVVTSLGRMVYYTTAGSWLTPEIGSVEPEPTETLVFLHGFGGGSSAYEWSKVYPAFATEYRVVAPDLMGWGRSEHPQRDYRAEDYIQTIIEFLEQITDRPITAIASSLTGALTIRAAIQRPELFQSLILSAPAGLSDFGEDYTRSFFAQLVSTPVLDRVLYSVGIATSGGIRNFLEQRQFAQPNRVEDEIVAAYLESAQQPNAELTALAFVRGDLCFDLARYIGQLTTPTAIFWGEKSQFTLPDLGRRLAKINPEAVQSFQIVPDAGLTPQLELPGVTIGLIRRYLKALH